MNGLFDFLKTPEGQAVAGGLFGYAANASRTAPINSIGRGGLAGLLAYGQGVDRQDRAAQEAQERQLRGLQLRQAQQALDDDAKAREILSRQYGAAGLPNAPVSGGPTNLVNAALPPDLQIGALPATPQHQASQVTPKADLYGQYKTLATQMAQAGLTAQATKYADLAEKFRPKFSTTPQQMMVGGKLTNVLVGEDGNVKTLDGYGVKPDLHFQDTGGSVLAIDKNATTGGQQFQKTGNPFSDLVLRGPNGEITPNAPLVGVKREIAQAGKTDVHVNTGQKGLENELKIRGEFKSEPIYKAHQEVESAYRQITRSLKMASPAGDLAGATKIMKILDPGSVVRESELGMAMKASGALDRLQYYAENIINGTKLTPQQRTDFQTLADQLYGESVKQFNGKRGEYAGFAKDYNLNADRILGPAITSPRLPSAAPEGPAQGAGTASFGIDPNAIAAELARRSKR